MIEHKDVDTPPVNGTPALPPAPEQKALPPAPEPPRRRSRAWIWLLLLAIAGFIGYRAYQNVQQKNAAAAAAQERRAANRAVPVAAVPARRGDMPIYLRGLGTVTRTTRSTCERASTVRSPPCCSKKGRSSRRGRCWSKSTRAPFRRR